MSNPNYTTPAPRAEAPEPSVPLAVMRQQTQALITALGPRKADKFLRAWADQIVKEDELFDLLPIRPAQNFPAARDASRGAASWFRSNLNVFVAAVRK